MLVNAVVGVWKPEQNSFVIAKEDDHRCTAVWASASFNHLQGSMCGERGIELLGDVWVCDHHEKRLTKWAWNLLVIERERARGAEQHLREQESKHARDSFVYFAVRDGFVKIGTSVNVAKRLASLARGDTMPDGMSPGPVRLLATMPGNRDNERWMHARFREDRLDSTEWFYPSHDLMTFIRGLTGYVGEKQAQLVG